jgi:hypothetical protein
VLGVAAACCDAELGADGRGGAGDPTELALLAAAFARDIRRETIEATAPRRASTPFDAQRRRMSVLRADGVLYVKGALESVVALCARGATRASAEEAAVEMAGGGLRRGDLDLLLVLGEYTWQQEVIKPADQWKWAVEQVHALGEYASDLNLEIALELEPFKLSFVNTLEKMEKFLNDVNLPNVKANLDISHLSLANTPAAKILDMKGRIAHIHFSDCDGKVHGDLPPGRGVVNFGPYLKEIKALGIEGAMSIELEYSPEPSKIAEWVKEAYTATDRLMKEAGLRN